MNTQAQQAQMFKVSILTQIFQRAVVSLALIGIWAILGHNVNWLLALATYAVVSILQGIYFIYIAGGFHTPVIVGGGQLGNQSQKQPLGFTCDKPVTSSADEVRRRVQQEGSH